MRGNEYGHKKMVVWSNIEKLIDLVCGRVLGTIPKTKTKLRDQIERAVSSVGANFIEGYYSGSTNEFIRFLGYSRRSLSELEYWLNFCFKTKLMSESLFRFSEDILIKTSYLTDRLTLSLKKKSSS